MQNFTYYTPTRVVFGKGEVERVGELLRAEGTRKVLIHYGGESARRSGLLERVERAVKDQGIDFVSLGGVVPNPRLSKVREGITLARAEGVDFILAVGGGSVIDSAKAIGYGIPYEGDVWDFYSGTAQPERVCPVGAVLTLSAAGSEMSNSSVISDEENGLKWGLNNDICRCRFAVMDPELTYTLPPYQTACGVVDILMHTMERYFTHEKDTALTDELAEGLMRTVMDCGRKALRDPKDYNARAQIMWAGSLSHNGLTGCGTVGDWASHRMEHELSALFDVAHGAGLAAIWGSWARYVYREEPERFAQFAVKVMGCPNDFRDPEKTALAGIEAMEQYYREIGMPTSVRELGHDLNESEIQLLAEKCARRNPNLGGFKTLSQDDMIQIFRMARG